MGIKYPAVVFFTPMKSIAASRSIASFARTHPQVQIVLADATVQYKGKDGILILKDFDTGDTGLPVFSGKVKLKNLIKILG